MNYIDHLFIVISTIPGCVSIPTFASLVGIPVGIASFVTGLKIYVLTAGIKKYSSIIKKNKKKDSKTVLLAKSKLIQISVLINLF